MRTEGTSRVLVSSHSLRGEMASNFAASGGRRSRGSFAAGGVLDEFEIPFGMFLCMGVPLRGCAAISKQGHAVTRDAVR